MFRPVTIDSRDAIRSQANGTLNFQALGVGFLGPKALSMFISAIETGMIIVLFARFFARRREGLVIQFLVYFVTFVALYVAFYIANLYSDNFLINSLTYPHFNISLIDREQVSNGNDIRVMVANIGAGLRQLGEWILLSSGRISISKSPSPTQPALRTSSPSPVSLVDRRLFLFSNGPTKFILHWYVPESHYLCFSLSV
jgi:hypothetical protein